MGGSLITTSFFRKGQDETDGMTGTPDQMLPSLLTVQEVARFLRVHVSTVRRWSNRGLLKSYRINPRGDRRFKREDVLAFLTKGQ